MGQSKALLVWLYPLCQVSLLDHELHLMDILLLLNQMLRIRGYPPRGLLVACLLMGECSTWNIGCGTIKSLTVRLYPLCQVSFLDHELHLMGILLLLNQMLRIRGYPPRVLLGTRLLMGECSTWNIGCGTVKSLTCAAILLLPSFIA